MKKYDKIAKNLLEGKTCQECKHCDDKYCHLNQQLDSNPYLGDVLLPEDNTCISWEKKPKLEMKITSHSFKTPARKIKMSWSKESEVAMQEYKDIDIEQELIKLASKKLQSAIDHEAHRIMYKNPNDILRNQGIKYGRKQKD